jgi:hypothetical protein
VFDLTAALLPVLGRRGVPWWLEALEVVALVIALSGVVGGIMGRWLHGAGGDRQ